MAQTNVALSHSPAKRRCCLIPEFLDALLTAITSAAEKPIAASAFGKNIFNNQQSSSSACFDELLEPVIIFLGKRKKGGYNGTQFYIFPFN